MFYLIFFRKKKPNTLFMFRKLISRKLLNLNKIILCVLAVHASLKFTKQITHFNT